MEEKWVGAIVMLVLISGWYCSCCCGCLEGERIALLSLKHSIPLPNGNVIASWGRHDDCCKWDGVECNMTTRRVIGLSLNHIKNWKSESWYLNLSLFLPFEELKSLFLSENSIFGIMKNEGLERFSSLSNLEVLDLSFNQLNNSILSSLASLSSLKVLNLAYNRMKGSLHIPGVERPLRLSNLEVLYSSDNFFNNRIISSLKGLPSLRILDLTANKLKGVLNITDLVALNKLKVLDLSYNKVKSFLAPKGVKRLLRLSNLKVLHLSGNSFNNKSLSSLRELSSLKSLDLSLNKLKGILNIKELTSLNNLKELDLSYNEVRSFVAPQELTALNNLKKLDLSFNKVRSFVAPKDFHTFKELEVLILRGSSLDNNFLWSIGTLSSLKVLSVSYCNLNGTLSNQGWCELQDLEELDLSENNFQGTLPSCLANLSRLQVLDISSNHFIGNIATGPITNMSSLEYLSFSSNNFQVPVSFRTFANHSKLKVLLGGGNNLMPEPLLQTPTPKFQLMFLSLSYLALKEPPYFIYHQNALRVVDLSHNNLTGGFPSWLLKNNTRLEVLNVGYNSISGPLQLPSQPHFNITTLDVTMNGLLGKIPINMSSVFPHLKTLIMSKNSFQGQIPATFGDMKSLETLSLPNNNLSGSIPDSFGHLNSLTNLDLSNNQLLGRIPELLVLGCPLRFLRLSGNKLQGQLFPLLFNLTELLILQLRGNNFSGEIPEFSSVNSFSPWVIDISNNHFSGKLPRWMRISTSLLSGLSLSENHFEGPIPVEFCGLGFMDFLDLSDNNLSGHIPKCLNPIQVRFVHLSNNRLTGPLTEGFLNNSVLEILDLSRNNLTGIIPDWIGGLSSLSILLLKANHFEGKIPVQLCQLKRLRMMDLSQNNLSGSIPFCLSNLTFKASAAHKIGFQISTMPVIFSLSDMGKNRLTKYSEFKEVISEVEFWVEFTTKSKSYVYNGSILNYMSGIDLSCNHLTGRIPPEVGYLNEIRALNISHNKLTGPIPFTFSNLKQIESLDLSYNNLIGRIPSQLTELNYLAVFSVAYNNLSGPTPDQKAQFGTFDESSYKGNPLLCGAPLQISCTKMESPPVLTNVSNDDMENNSLVDMSVFYWSFVVTYVAALMAITTVLYINPYWRRAWFYFIDVCITSCYYFVLDSFCWFSKRII